MLDFIKKVFDYVDKINPTFKTIIIVALLFWCTQVCLVNQGKVFITDYIESVEYNNKKAEEYSLKIAPRIRQQIESIMNKDMDASNVLLLSFHNTKKSLQGFSYMYVTALAEALRGLDGDCIDMWKDLPYLQYGSEIDKIRRLRYLRADSIESLQSDFPQIYKRLRMCNAEAAAIYPMEGIDSEGEEVPIGLIIVIYDKPKQYYLGYYNTCIAQPIQILSTLLNYNTTVKQK